jgi:hypothetical protein
MVGKVDNCDIVEADEITVNSDVLYESITDMAAFRYLPLALKKSFEPDMYTINDAVDMPNDCIMDNVEYAQNTDLLLLVQNLVIMSTFEEQVCTLIGK